MQTLDLIVQGEQAEAAVQELAGVLGETAGEWSVSPLSGAGTSADKALDPIAVAALVLSLPGALLAAMDLADRLGKRRRARELIETAGRLRIERRVEVLTVTLDGHRSLADMDPDELLDLAGQEPAERES